MKLLSILLAASFLLVGCGHRMPADSDLFNEGAAIPSGVLPYNPFSWKVITSSINPARQTMSTLYGNNLAVQSARSGQPAYPAGAVLAYVTWSQREDPHWFGGRTPDQLRSVEFVTLSNSRNASYLRFEGPVLTPQVATGPHGEDARRDAILAMRASVMP